MVKTLRSCAAELNMNPKWTKTISNSSSKQSNGQDSMKMSDYEDDQSWKRNNKEVSNWQKNGPTRNGEGNGWRQNKSPNNDRKQQSGSNNNNSYPSSVAFTRQRRNDKKNLVFDKRDFLFPDTRKEIREQIQLDEVAKYSVTDTRTADDISDFIIKLDGLNHDNITITDGTACVGGNTISFCKKFTKVQAVELDQSRYNMLQHNLQLLECTNAACYHANYLDLLSDLRQDVVFLDPPWGGPSYKDQDKVELFLGDIPLDEICGSLKRRTKYIIIKAPTNLNYEKFRAKITGNLQVLHRFRKMLLIVVDYYHPLKVVQQEQITDVSNKNNAKTNMKENQNRIKETIKSHDIDTKSQKAADNSNYNDIAIEAAHHAATYYGDYVSSDYIYMQAFLAAHRVARDGTKTARDAAAAAYQRAIVDVQYASNYNDPRVAEAFLSVASDHDYYIVDTIDGTEGFDNTDELDCSNGIENGDCATSGTVVSSINGNGSTDGINDINNVDDTNGVNGTIHSDLAAACKAPLDDEDF